MPTAGSTPNVNRDLQVHGSRIHLVWVRRIGSAAFREDRLDLVAPWW